MPMKRLPKPLSQEEEAFFQQFYEEYSGFLYFIAGRYAASPADREDIVQDSVIRLLCNTPTLMTLNQAKTAKYIALTVKSAFLDCQKQKHGTQEVDLDDKNLEDLLLSAHSDAQTTQLELCHLRQSLSERDWLVLEGKYILGYSQEELSELVGVSPDSIRMILHRARNNARSILLTEDALGGEHHG